jgi:hypothetical protein
MATVYATTMASLQQSNPSTVAHQPAYAVKDGPLWTDLELEEEAKTSSTTPSPSYASRKLLSQTASQRPHALKQQTIHSLPRLAFFSSKIVSIPFDASARGIARAGINGSGYLYMTAGWVGA